MATNRVPDGNGGIAPSILTTTGDILYASAAQVPARLAVGSANQALGVSGGIPAWQASPQSTLTTTGDIMYASAANTPARLAVGSTSQVLTVAGGVPTWAAPAAGGKVLQVVMAEYSTNFSMSSATYADTGMTVTITPTLNTSKILVLHNGNYARSGSASAVNIKILRGSTAIRTYNAQMYDGTDANGRGEISMTILDAPATTSATTYKVQIAQDAGTSVSAQYNSETSTIVCLEIGA